MTLILQSRLLIYFRTNKPQVFCRIPVVLESRKSSRGVGEGGCGPLHPPPRSAPFLSLHELLRPGCIWNITDSYELRCVTNLQQWGRADSDLLKSCTSNITDNCIAWLPTAMTDSTFYKEGEGHSYLDLLVMGVGSALWVFSLVENTAWYPCTLPLIGFGTSQDMFVFSFSCRFWRGCSFQKIDLQIFDLVNPYLKRIRWIWNTKNPNSDLRNFDIRCSIHNGSEIRIKI